MRRNFIAIAIAALLVLMSLVVLLPGIHSHKVIPPLNATSYGHNGEIANGSYYYMSNQTIHFSLVENLSKYHGEGLHRGFVDLSISLENDLTPSSLKTINETNLTFQMHHKINEFVITYNYTVPALHNYATIHLVAFFQSGKLYSSSTNETLRIAPVNEKFVLSPPVSGTLSNIHVVVGPSNNKVYPVISWGTVTDIVILISIIVGSTVGFTTWSRRKK